MGTACRDVMSASKDEYMSGVCEGGGGRVVGGGRVGGGRVGGGGGGGGGGGVCGWLFEGV